MVGLKGRGSTTQESKKAPTEIKVCGGTRKVSGFTGNVPCQFVVDTGADVTILSSRVFHKLDSAESIEDASNEGVVRGLDGQVIPVIGRGVTLEITIGEMSSKLEVWVASIQEECILGGDFLKREGCAIDYPRQTLRIGDAEIPLLMGGEDSKCRRVILDKAVRVPPFTEMVIPAKVEGDRANFRWGTTGPPSLVRRSGDIIVVRTVVDLEKNYIPVRVGNLSSERKKLRKGTELQSVNLLQVSRPPT